MAEEFRYADGRLFVPIDAEPTQIDALLSAAYSLIAEKWPDAVVCGLSTFNFGLDEAVLYWTAKARMNIPSFQFLETWGTFNHLLDGYPCTYLAFDEATQNYAHMGAKAPIKVVGSPKHERYARMYRGPQKKVYFNLKKLGITGEMKVIGYFGQDPQSPGHSYNFKVLIDAISEYQKRNPCKLLFRAHPNWLDSYGTYWRYLDTKGVNAIDVTAEPIIEDLLMVCDIVVTCYSTITTDHAFLSSYSDSPIGTSLCLLCGNEIKEHVVAQCGFWLNPLLERGIGYYAKESKDVAALLNGLLHSEELKQEYFRRTKLLRVGSPRKKIIDLLSSSINNSNDS